MSGDSDEPSWYVNHRIGSNTTACQLQVSTWQKTQTWYHFLSLYLSDIWWAASAKALAFTFISAVFISSSESFSPLSVRAWCTQGFINSQARFRQQNVFAYIDTLWENNNANRNIAPSPQPNRITVGTRLTTRLTATLLLRKLYSGPNKSLNKSLSYLLTPLIRSPRLWPFVDRI